MGDYRELVREAASKVTPDEEYGLGTLDAQILTIAALVDLADVLRPEVVVKEQPLEVVDEIEPGPKPELKVELPLSRRIFDGMYGVCRDFREASKKSTEVLRARTLLRCAEEVEEQLAELERDLRSWGVVR